MPKIGPRETQIRALRAKKAAGKPPKRPKPQPKAKQRQRAKPSVRSNGGVSAVSTPIVKNGPSFDRTAYQRVYCRLNRKHGPVASWPADALAELRTVSTGKKTGPQSEA